MSDTSRTLGKFSIGVGDRFAHEAVAQLRACQLMLEEGIEVTPVWNKSNREHTLIGSEPASTRAAVTAAVKQMGWRLPYYLDADHIGLKTVDRFMAVCDFFTIDVADFIGQPAEPAATAAFVARHPELVGSARIAGMAEPVTTTHAELVRIASKYLLAVQEAGKVYRHIAAAKGPGNFIPEVSMDETDIPQTPPELLVILAALAEERIPLQTIAPRFTGRFNKGVDYVGDVAQFEREFNDDICVIAHAVKQYGLPANLKLSIHSGSDKFSIYPAVHQALARHQAGVHLKTAGTTWLEECIGLAEAGGAGLQLAQDIYGEALAHIDELCAPYATVIDIDRARLPSAATVQSWTSEQFVSALRHDPRQPAFNRSLRQLLHVGFKIAAKIGPRFLEQLKACESTISRNVTGNLYQRHLRPLFFGL